MNKIEKNIFRKIQKRIADYFYGISRRKENYKKSEIWGRFPENLFLDPEKIAEELGAEEQGCLDGSEKIPPSDASEYDQFHTKLLSVFKKHYRYANYERKKILTIKESELNAYELPDSSREMQGKKDEFSFLLNEIFLDHEDDLKDSYKKSCELERKYKLFKKIHNRKDFPKETHHPSLPLAVAFIIILIEGVLNSFWLQDATDYGLRAGAVVAGTVSAVNIMTAMLAGWLARYTNYNDPQNKKWFSRKRTSFCSCCASFFLLTLIICINWLFSGFRTIAMNLQDLNTALSQVLPEMRKDPNFWVDQSWLLFSLGIVFAAIAFFEGYSQFSDTYPGYSKNFKQKEKSRKEYKIIKYNIYNQFKELYGKIVSDLDFIILNTKKSFSNFKKNADTFRSMILFHNSELIESENILNSIAKKYRDANIQHRGESFPPQYFSYPISLDDNYLSENMLDVSQVDELYREFNRKIEGYVTIKNELCATILAKYNEERENLQYRLKDLEGIVQKEINNPAEPLTSAEAKQNNFY